MTNNESFIGINFVRDILSYDSKTGVFVWKKRTSQRTFSGDIAGFIERFGYVVIKINRRKYRAHRLAWLLTYGSWPKEHIDHINGVRHDNRIENLREANDLQNAANSGNRIKRLGQPRCVYKHCRKWKAVIRHNKKLHYIGVFSTPELASIAYEEKSRELFGSFKRETANENHT